MDYSLEALLYAEKYGIIEYDVVAHMMLYTEFYKNEGRFLHLLNLVTNEEKIIQIEKPYWEIQATQ
jgi:hypothetical protein